MRAGDPRPRASDAVLLLWLRGLVDRRASVSVARVRPLSDVLSVGLRSNAFDATIEACEALGLGARWRDRIAADVSAPALVDLQLKFVRLLKRRGNFSRALDTLAAAALAWSEAEPDRYGDLVAANLLYGVAKAVGSHQNRVDQSSLLCGFCEARIRDSLRDLGVPWRVFLSSRHAALDLRGVEGLWSKVVDYRVKQQYAQADACQRAALLRQWNQAVAFELRHGIETGRARFARLLMLAKTASDEDLRESCLAEFEFLLAKMMSKASPDLRGISIRYAQAAEIYLAAKAVPRAGQLLDVALKNAEHSSDWASIARAHLIRSDLLLQDDGPLGPSRWEAAMRELQRADDAVQRHVEPPLPLLLSSCRRQARIALAMGDFAKAKQHIEDALSHVAAIRSALVQEDWTRQRGPAPPGTPAWLAPIGRLLTTRERALLQARAITDWDALVTTQNELVRLLEQANLMETNARIVSVSAARVAIIRSSIAHDAANILNTGLSRLMAESESSGNVVRRQDILRAQSGIDAAIRQHIACARSIGDASAALGAAHHWHSAAELCRIDADALALLRMFAPALNMIDVDAAADFYVRCDPDLFRVMLMQFLLNAAQEVGASTGAAISIRLTYSEPAASGQLEVRDSAGRVQQLAAAVANLAGGTTEPASGRSWGLRHALAFFRETWGCRERVGGEESVYSLLTLTFPPGTRLQARLPR
jgi:hypothetical protein